MITKDNGTERIYPLPLLGAAVACVLGFSLVQTPSVLAHGIVSEDVVKMEQTLETRPNDLNLRMDYVGKLIAIAHFDEALEQVALLREANPGDPVNDWLAATAQFEAGSYEQAHKSLTRYLKVHGDDGYARSLNGRSLQALKNYQSAAEQFVAGIEAGYRTTDMYLYAAKSFEQAGEPQKAIAVLEYGLSTLGDLPVFYLDIAKILHTDNEHLGAATRVQQMIDTLNPDLRTESYYSLKGDYLVAAGENQQAAEAYEYALKELQQRDEVIARSPDSKQLHRQLTAQLRRLNQLSR